MTTSTFKLCRLHITVNILNFLSCLILCKDFRGSMEISEYGFTLENHYRSLNAPNLGTCFFTCFDDSNACKSFTYDVVSGLCKLSTETKSTKPELFKEKENCIYMNVDSAFETTTSPYQTTAFTQITTLSPEETTTTAPTTTTSPQESTTLEQTSTANSPTTTSPPTTAASGTATFDQATFCIDKAAGDYPYPGDCTKYITCAPGNIIYVRECYYSVIPGICNDC